MKHRDQHIHTRLDMAPVRRLGFQAVLMCKVFLQCMVSGGRRCWCRCRCRWQHREIFDRDTVVQRKVLLLLLPIKVLQHTIALVHTFARLPVCYINTLLGPHLPGCEIVVGDEFRIE